MPEGLTAVWAAALVVTTVPTAALACRCLPRSAEEAFRNADAVVVARVDAAPRATGFKLNYGLRIQSYWKQPLPDRMTIDNAANTCSAELVAGRTYVLYLKKTGYGYVTNSCMGNLPIERAGYVVEQLRRIKPPSYFEYQRPKQ